MVKDSELLERLHDVLRTSDLDTATGGSVRRRLEQDLGIDLTDRKAYIREQIDIFLGSQFNNKENPEDEDVEADVDRESGNVKSENEGDDGSEEEEDPEEDGPEEEDPEEEEEEEVDAKNTKKEKSTKTTGDAKKRGGGFSKPCALSPQLQMIIGEPELARTEVVKKIWAYIKEKDLQNPKNKRKILCDEMLQGIFRVKSIDMFQMNKALSKHIWPLDEEYAPVKPSKNTKQKKRSNEEEEPKQKGKRQKGKGSGFVSTLPISEALVQFFGTGEIALSRAEVVKRMWEYFKQNDLQDPSDKRRILCDDKLRELFKVDSFVGFTVSKLLTAHFIKEE